MIAFLLLSVLLTAAVIALLLYPLRRVQAAGAQNDPTLAAYRSRLAELEREHADGLLSDADLHEAIDELERELLQNTESSTAAMGRKTSGSRALPFVLVIVVAVGGGLLYALVGAPRMLTEIGNDALSRERIEQLRGMPPEDRIGTLEEWLDRNPGSIRGWSLLGQAYRDTEAYGDAANAFARARDAGSDDAWLIARQAEALLLANDRRFTRSVRRLLAEALERDPRNGLALMLSGQAALVAGDPQTAIDYWQRLLDALPEDNEQRAMIEQLVERVAQEADIDAAAADAAGGDIDDDVRLDVRVSLSDSLRSDARPGDTVFVFARAAGGDGPPLAVARTRVESLPARIVLDDRQSMTPQARLSEADTVVVTARVSRSGEAMPQSGDLEGRSGSVSVDDADGVEVVIDRRLP